MPGHHHHEHSGEKLVDAARSALTEAGGIKRLSIAVVVDGTYVADAAGNSVYTPRAQAEIDQITALVKSAVGFSDARGDQVQVANLQFADRPELAAQGTSEPGLFDFTRDDLMSGAEMAVTLLIALALMFFVLRPLLKRVLSPEAETLALPAAVEVGQGTTLDADGNVITSSGEPMSEAARAALANHDWIEDAKALGEQQLQQLKSVGALVEENPKQAALIVRGWLTNAA